MNRNQIVGKRGEDLASEFLIEQGFQILEKNTRTPHGEIDLVAIQKDSLQSPSLVFIEVKTRTSRTFGFPEEAMSRQKKSHLLNAISYYLQNHAEIEMDWRIDVIAISMLKGGQKSEIKHFVNAISSETEEF